MAGDISRRDALHLTGTGIGYEFLETGSASEAIPDKADGTQTTETASEATDSISKEIEQRIYQARHNIRNNTKPKDPLVLLHISDVHGDEAALRRAVTWAGVHKSDVTDIIATGDLAHLQFSEGMDFWDRVPGAKSILTCIGNHDVYSDLESYKPYRGVSVKEAAKRYIDAYAPNWGTIDHISGTTWYAKDYPTYGVRLIVLDALLYTGENSAKQAAEQNDWLERTLSDARERRLAVIIAEHYALGSDALIDCSWSPFDRAFTYGPYLSKDVTDRVQAFINGGGTFCVYLCGHCHCDAAHTLKGHPEQFALTVPCLSNAPDQWIWGDMDRSHILSRDAMNLVMIDTANGLVKALRIGADRDLALQKRTAISWDYRRHRLVYAG